MNYDHVTLALIFRDGVLAGQIGLHPDDWRYPIGSDAWRAFAAGVQTGKAGW